MCFLDLLVRSIYSAMTVLSGDLILTKDPLVRILTCDLQDREALFLRVLNKHFGTPQRQNQGICGVLNSPLLFCIPGSPLSGVSARTRNVGTLYTRLLTPCRWPFAILLNNHLTSLVLPMIMLRLLKYI
jgi:hypothetical protein